MQAPRLAVGCLDSVFRPLTPGPAPVYRSAVLDALSPLGNDVHGGEGAIYLWAKLPAGAQTAHQHTAEPAGRAGLGLRAKGLG